MECTIAGPRIFGEVGRICNEHLSDDMSFFEEPPFSQRPKLSKFAAAAAPLVFSTLVWQWIRIRMRNSSALVVIS